VSEDDGLLGEAFALQRREDARNAPAFAPHAREARPHPAAGRRWALAGAIALALVLALVPRLGTRTAPPLLPMPAPGELRTSTDMLLRTPGAGLLGTQPPTFLPDLNPDPALRPTSSGPASRMTS
jgi:hypothetical protein